VAVPAERQLFDYKENKMEKNQDNRIINRRSFLRSTAAVGAGLAISPLVLGQSTSTGSKLEDINVAILGAGVQGGVLTTACTTIPGVRIKAVCDIWKEFRLTPASRKLNILKHPNNAYEDYAEMLDKEKDLNAVIIATPDFWHSRHTVACLEKGLHVYCEKEMSNTLDGARKMVEAAKKSGKLLQIGHQRRSNPQYIYCYEKYITEAKLLGQITTINGQWNRSKAACEDNPLVPDYDIAPATLQKYEFDSMQQFLNWRWYKGKGGGPIVDLGSHQIDVYSWFLQADPKSVMASGGIDYWKGRDWYDNVMATYEYQTNEGTVRAFYQTTTTNSGQGYFEQFMGIEGTLLISESSNRSKLYREEWVEESKWDPYVKKGYMKPIIEEQKEVTKDTGVAIDARETLPPPSYEITATIGDKLVHQPHLENFFDAIRGKTRLNCPAEAGYATAVAVLKVNEAVEAQKKLQFTPEEFKV
jgi:predicted dehydrogenase